MSRLASIRSDIPVEKVRRVIKATNDGTLRLRLMIIEKLLSEPNMSLQEVAKLLIVNRETVTKCLQLFNKGGIDSLKPKRAGRKEGNPKYEDRIFVKLLSEVTANNRSWSVYEMQNYINNNFGVQVPESTIYYRLSKMGYSKRSKNKIA